MTDPKDDMLDDLFATARAQAPVPGADLTARVLAAAQPAAAPAPAARAKSGLRLGRFFAAIGGWPAVAGLTTATMAGVWIGFAPPAAVEDFTASLLGDPVPVGFFTDEIAFELGALADG